MRLSTMSISAACLAASSALALEFTPAQSETVEAVEHVMPGPLAEAREAGAPVRLLAASVDLDGDGIDDSLVRVESGYLCGGAGGCPIIVLLMRDGVHVEAGTLFSDFVEAGLGTTGGMRDLILTSQLGSTTVRWTGAAYEP